MQRSTAVFLALYLAAGFPSLAQTNATPAPANSPSTETAVVVPRVSVPAQSSICKMTTWPKFLSSKCQAYPGKGLPKQDVAILKLDNIGVASVNGETALGCYAALGKWDKSKPECQNVTSIELLPGVYNFAFAPIAGNPGTQNYTGPELRVLTVEAGKKYTARGTYPQTNCVYTGTFGHMSYFRCTYIGSWGVQLGEAKAK